MYLSRINVTYRTDASFIRDDMKRIFKEASVLRRAPMRDQRLAVIV